MFQNQPNWKFHVKVISEALNILEARHASSESENDFNESEAPIAIEEARASLAHLKDFLSRDVAADEVQQGLRKFA